MPRPVNRFRSTRRVRVSAEILRQLKSAILSGRLRPGDRLPSEKELADQFRSSRGPVREAIRSLEQAGLLVVRRGFGGGAFVGNGDLRPVTDSLSMLIRLGRMSIHHLTEARVILEPQLARLAAERITEEALEGIRRHIERHAAAIEAGHLHATANLGFHRLIAEASRNPTLVLFANSLADLIVREVVARIQMDETTNRSNLAFHRRLYDALARRDPAAAAAVMLEHVLEVQSRLARLLPQEESPPTAVSVQVRRKGS